MITLNCSQFPPVENVHGSDTRRFQTLHLGVQRFSKLQSQRRCRTSQAAAAVGSACGAAAVRAAVSGLLTASWLSHMHLYLNRIKLTKLTPQIKRRVRTCADGLPPRGVFCTLKWCQIEY